MTRVRLIVALTLSAAAAFLTVPVASAQFIDDSDATCSFQNLSFRVHAGTRVQECDWDEVHGGYKWRWEDEGWSK